jgi:arylsulfatase A-like enzyme
MPLHVIFRRRAGALAGAAALTLAAVGAAGCEARIEPSVLVVVVDTLRADHVGSLRRPGDDAPAATPSLDRWAEDAVRFRRASSPAPFTMPAMAAMFAGVYPDRAGVSAHEPGTTFRSWKGDTIADAAKRSGMKTAAVVANPWLARATTGFDRGFDEYVRLYQPGQPPGASGAAAVTTEAIRLLDEAEGRRFLVWAHYFDPHMPYTPPAGLAGEQPSRVMLDFDAKDRDLAQLYRGEGYSQAELERARRLYEGEVRYVDREVGRLLDHLEQSGRARETIVVVASDHGESLGEHGLYFAHDYTLYEELVRVPLLVKRPGALAELRDHEVSLLDVAPTLCAAARLPCRGPFDGRDLFAAATPRTLFAATTPRRARGTPWEGLEVPGLAGRWTMSLSGSEKIVRIPRANGLSWERYDLRRDPLEQRPLARDPAGEAALERWIREMDDARPPAPPAPARRQQRRDEKSLRSLGYLN